MTKIGGTTKRFYRETHGMKVSGGQKVKGGTVLTREGDKWKPGLNVIGRTSLVAGCDGEVYFTRKRGSYKRTVTFIHIRPDVKEEKAVSKEK